MKKYCTYCGHELKRGQFCPSCGERIKSDTADIAETNTANSDSSKGKNEKLIFTYKNVRADLQEIIDAHRGINEKITIRNAAINLMNICKLPYGLAKKVIKEAYYNGRVYEIDDKMVTKYIIKTAAIIGVVFAFSVGIISSAFRSNNSTSNDKTQGTSSQTVSESNGEGNNESNSESKPTDSTNNTETQSVSKPETKPTNIENVDYKEFYNNYSDDKKGKWIRISAKVSYISGDKDSITIREGLSGLDNIHVKLKEKREDVNEGSYVTIVGKVGSKILSYLYLEESYIESLGDEAKSNAKDYMTVDYKQLYKDYEENAIKADGKYKDKLIQITGKVDDIFREVMGHPYVTFSVDKYFQHVQAVFSKDEESKVAELKKGQTITVRGRCKGKTMNVLIDDCIIIKK